MGVSLIQGNIFKARKESSLNFKTQAQHTIPQLNQEVLLETQHCNLANCNLKEIPYRSIPPPPYLSHTYIYVLGSSMVTRSKFKIHT